LAKKARRNQRRSKSPAGEKRPASSVGVRRTKSGEWEGQWELVHPRGVDERSEDMEEVRQMVDAGEIEIAIDELRWLLGGCSDFIEAHCLLGELALAEDNSPGLARGHFGYAYQLGLTALRRAGMPRPLPYNNPVNRAFFEAGKGLAWCLQQAEKPRLAREVAEQLLACDGTDPLGMAAMLASLPAG
jgi:hypothetical protein